MSIQICNLNWRVPKKKWGQKHNLKPVASLEGQLKLAMHFNDLYPLVTLFLKTTGDDAVCFSANSTWVSLHLLLHLYKWEIKLWMDMSYYNYCFTDIVVKWPCIIHDTYIFYKQNYLVN